MRMRERGETNFVSVVMMLGFAGAIYMLFLYVPIYSDHLTVKEIVGAAYVSSDQNTEEGIRAKIIGETDRIGNHREEDGAGGFEIKPGLGITPDQIEVVRGEKNSIRIDLRYERAMRFVPTQRVRMVKFHEFRDGVPR